MRVRQNRMRNNGGKKMNERKIQLERGSVIDIGSGGALDAVLDRYEKLSVAAEAVSDAYETLSDGVLEKAIWNLREVIDANAKNDVAPLVESGKLEVDKKKENNQ
jgi:hypothetical protein